MLTESERLLVLGDAMFSLSRLDSLFFLEAWRDVPAFRSFLLLELPMSDYQHSLMDFKDPESSAWARDCSKQGLANLLRAAENFGMWQTVVNGGEFEGCMGALRILWQDPNRFVQRYQVEFLHLQLERAIRLYAQEMTKTQDRVARVAGGLALGGPTELVALLTWCIGEFVALVMGGTLELPPHHQYYDSEQYLRIANKPGTGGGKGKGVNSNAGGDKGKGGTGGSGVRVPPYHKDGMCLWWLAGQLGLKNAKGEVFKCRTPEGEDPIKHTALAKVTLMTVKKLLRDDRFTSVCSSDALKTSILARAVADKTRFKGE